MKKIIPFVVIALITGLGACKKGKDEDKTPANTTFDETEVLKNWTNNIIIPSYKRYQESTLALHSAATNFTAASNTTNLRILQEAHSFSYQLWQTVSVFEFGPAENLLLKSNTNTYPCDIDALRAKINSGTNTVNAKTDLNKKGFPALDYILFALPESEAIKSKNYIQAITQDLKDNANSVSAKWKGYSSTFLSAKGISAGSSISVMLNAVNQHLERYHREAKFAIPSGIRTFSKTPLPKNVEGTYEKLNSLEFALVNMQTLRSIYMGINIQNNKGKGLDDFVKFNNGEDLNEQIIAQFDACTKSYSKINMALNDAVVSNKTQVKNTIDELQKLTFLLKADLPAKLGVLITYQDSDGD